jgi:hypothetical protein
LSYSPQPSFCTIVFAAFSLREARPTASPREHRGKIAAINAEIQGQLIYSAIGRLIVMACC